MGVKGLKPLGNIYIVRVIQICLYFPQVTIYRIECNIQFARLKLLAIKSSNDSKLFKGNQSLSNTMDQPANGEAEDGKVKRAECLFLSPWLTA